MEQAGHSSEMKTLEKTTSSLTLSLTRSTGVVTKRENSGMKSLVAFQPVMKNVGLTLVVSIWQCCPRFTLCSTFNMNKCQTCCGVQS